METDPTTLPKDVKQKLLLIRDALIKNDINGAYHALYSIADPDFFAFEPWDSLENEKE